MRCREARKLLGRRLDGRLDEAERAALGAHLASCARCTAELAAWEAAADALRHGGPTPVPPGLAERAWHAAMEADAVPPPLAAWFVGPARRVLVAGALAAAAIWIGVAAGGPARPAQASVQDPMDAAVALWTGVGDGR